MSLSPPTSFQTQTLAQADELSLAARARLPFPSPRPLATDFALSTPFDPLSDPDSSTSTRPSSLSSTSRPTADPEEGDGNGTLETLARPRARARSNRLRSKPKRALHILDPTKWEKSTPTKNSGGSDGVLTNAERLKRGIPLKAPRSRIKRSDPPQPSSRTSGP